MSEAPNHAFAVSAAGALPTASTWLSFLNSSTPGTITITTIGGETVTFALPSGMYPIRATSVVTIGTGVTNLVAWWT